MVIRTSSQVVVFRNLMSRQITATKSGQKTSTSQIHGHNPESPTTVLPRRNRTQGLGERREGRPAAIHAL